MPTLPVPLTVECQLRGYHEDDRRETVLHYRHGAAGPPPDDNDLITLATNFDLAITTALKNCMSNTSYFNDIRVIDISVVGGHQYDAPFAVQVPGNRTGEVLPGFANVALAKHVNVHRRGTQGRIFVADIIEGDQNDDVIGNALIQLLLLLAQAILQHILDSHGQSYAPVVASKKHGTFYTITDVTFDTIMDTLRTRGKGKRRHKRRIVTTG